MNFPNYSTRTLKTVALATLSLALSLVLIPAHALDVAGVNYRALAQTGNAALFLNGAGVRQQSSVGLYTAGLYLEKKAATPKEVVSNTTGAKQLRLVILRDISAKKLSELLSQGLIANNSDEDLASLIPEMFNVSMMINDQGKLLPGDAFQIDSSPAGETTITITGKGRGMPVSQTFAKPGLFKVMMGIWLGERPADADLKNALLGQPI